MERIVEAGCGAAILDEDGRLLLIRRLRQPEAGAWGLPGGRIEFAEKACDAVCREIREELGVEISLTGLACIAETIDGGDGRHWIAPVYTARLLAGSPAIMEPWKHDGLGWFSLHSLPSPLTSPTLAWLASRHGLPGGPDGDPGVTRST